MKKTAIWICCGLFSLASVLSPLKAMGQTDDDKKFLAMAAQADVNEIKLSELADSKATNPDVKAFAQKMVTEHKQMTASMKPYDKLNGLSGPDFDKEYRSIMVSDHTKALDAFTKEAKDTKDGKFQAAVLKGKTMVAAHKNMAYDLKKKL
jgi:putative membrane protein